MLAWSMPVWGQVVTACAAVVIAVGVIWNKGLRPAAKTATAVDRFIPVANQLNKYFADAPELLPVLVDIAKQFHTDSGTTLRDVINRIETGAIKQAAVVDQLVKVVTRLETTASENQVIARVLKQNGEVTRALAEQDRTELAEAVRLIRQVRAGVDAAAEDLAASQQRADVVTGDAGAAADTASKSPPAEP